ncbi:MAG: TetR/AcrR family transcriptional regulator [bacterium]
MIKQDTRTRRTPKKSYHHDGLREAVLEKTLLFLRDHPVQDLSMREIARDLGVSHMAPYRHFASKEDILAALIENGFRQLTAKFQESDQKGTLIYPETFYAHVKAYVQFFLKNPDVARLMFTSGYFDKGDFTGVHDAGHDAFSCLTRLVQRGQKEGFIGETQNLYMVSFMIWSSVHGASVLIFEKQFQEIDQAPDVDVGAFTRFLAEKLLLGFSSAKSQGAGQDLATD